MKATLTGAIIVNLATIGWAIYTVTIRKCLKDIDSGIAFGVVSVYSTFGFLGLMFMFGNPSDCLSMPGDIWLALVLSAILAIALSHSLYYMTIKHIGATIPALALLTTPFLVSVLAGIFLNESLNTTQWIWGIVLIAGGAFSISAQREMKSD
jgi:drug/metabolite transporter (DMT)-like permease